jgi:Thioredoxin
MPLDIYYSYACRDSYLVYAWLKRVEANGQPLEIHWHPFAIQMDDPENWKRPWGTANSELRGFIAAEAAKCQGREAFLRFHDVLEQAVHERLLELRDESTLIGAAKQAGLDMDRFQKDWHDSQLAKNAHQSHMQAIERWNVYGTPTIVFPGGRSYHLELNEIPAKEDALETFQAIETLTISHPYLGQLKATSP